MLHPSYTDLMNIANSEVEQGEQPVVIPLYWQLRNAPDRLLPALSL